MKNSAKLIDASAAPIRELLADLAKDEIVAQLTVRAAVWMQRLISQSLDAEVHGPASIKLSCKKSVLQEQGYAPTKILTTPQADCNSVAATAPTFNLTDEQLEWLSKYVGSYGFWLEPSETAIGVYHLEFKA